MKTPCGTNNRLNWALADAASTWNRKILMPQVVEPAHPPINIKNRKKMREKFPHNPKSSVTYPVPDKIEITLNDDILILSKTLLS